MVRLNRLQSGPVLGPFPVLRTGPWSTSRISLWRCINNLATLFSTNSKWPRPCLNTSMPLKKLLVLGSLPITSRRPMPSDWMAYITHFGRIGLFQSHRHSLYQRYSITCTKCFTLVDCATGTHRISLECTITYIVNFFWCRSCFWVSYELCKSVASISIYPKHYSTPSNTPQMFTRVLPSPRYVL